MQTINLPLESLREAHWNTNRMNEVMVSRLRESILRYGLVENLVTRALGEHTYEVIGGNWRLKVLRDLGFTDAPCFILSLDDVQARLLAQALNRIEGEDDLGLRAELLRSVLQAMPEAEVLAILPDTAESLRALASLGQESMAEHLEKWRQAQGARLKHLQFQLTSDQLEVVEEALAKLLPQASRGLRDNPNTRGEALYLLCRQYLEKEDKS